MGGCSERWGETRGLRCAQDDSFFILPAFYELQVPPLAALGRMTKLWNGHGRKHER